LYGLHNFAFNVVHLCDRDDLLDIEQQFLDWLFSLPESLRYNFNRTAGSLLGYKHTEENRAQMSGANNLSVWLI